eukprot:GFKZ01010498.1.p1 GENE.GFKZ01010498.1~~GFKZ01010498.1.p1  ORF type:complete len:360 (+),score=7.35 GFKZ01010498.1:417-1496(+)
MLPPSCTTEGAEKFDGMMERCFRMLAGGYLNTKFSRAPATRETQGCGKTVPWVRTNLRENIAAAAFLAFSSASNRLCKVFLPGPTKDLKTYDAAIDAHRKWSLSCPPPRIIQFSVFCSKKTSPQKARTDAIHEAVQNGIPLGDTRRQAFRASMAVPGAKAWVYCAPCPRLQTSIESRKLSIWLQYYCQVPMFPAYTLCPRHNFPDTLYEHGDHLMHCRHGAQRINRHDRQVTLLARDLAKAACHPTVEPREGLHRTRPDIRAIGNSGGTDYFDVAFVNPLAPINRRARVFNPLTSLNAARNAKHRRYHSFLATSARGRLAPVPISTLGGWHPNAYAVLTEVARNVAVRAVETYGKVGGA